MEIVQHSQTDKPIEKSYDKQGLFVEYIQFLIKIGMFNKNVVMSMLSNKEICIWQLLFRRSAFMWVFKIKIFYKFHEISQDFDFID